MRVCLFRHSSLHQLVYSSAIGGAGASWSFVRLSTIRPISVFHSRGEVRWRALRRISDTGVMTTKNKPLRRQKAPLLKPTLLERVCRRLRSRVIATMALTTATFGVCAPGALADGAGPRIESWKIVGRADLELGAHKAANGQFMICATDSQINFGAKAHPIFFDREVTVGARSPYRVSSSYLGNAGSNVVDADKQPLIAYMLWRHLKEAGQKAEGGNWRPLAGLVDAVHSSTNSRKYLADKGPLPAQVRKDAKSYLAEAAKYAGPYRLVTRWHGQALGVQVLSAAGNPIGVKVQVAGQAPLVINGIRYSDKASFKSGAKEVLVKPQRQQGKQTLLELKAGGVPAVTFRVWEHHKAQDMMLSGYDSELTAKVDVPATPVPPKQTPPAKTPPEKTPPAKTPPEKEVPKETPPVLPAADMPSPKQVTPPESPEPVPAEPEQTPPPKVAENPTPEVRPVQVETAVQTKPKTTPSPTKKRPLAKTGSSAVLAGGAALALAGLGVAFLGLRRRI